MNVKEIKEFAKTIKEHHNNRLKEQTTDEQYYDDKFDVAINNPYHVIRTGSAAHIVDTDVAHLELVSPQVFREAKKNTEAAKKSALKVGKFLNYLIKQWQPEVGELYRNGVHRGEFIGQVQYNDEYKGKLDDAAPILFSSPDPMIVFCHPYDAIVPSKVVKSFKMSKLAALAFNPTVEGEVEYLGYFDNESRYAEIGEKPVTNDIEPILGGFVPFVHGYSGFGRKTEKGDPATLAVGRLRKIRGRLKEECEIESRVDSIIGLFANPIREIEQTDPTDRGADLKTLEEQTIAPGYNLVTPYGFKSHLYTPEVASAQLFQHLYQIRQALGVEIPPVMQGMGSADQTGRLADIQYEHASSKYVRLIHNIELCLAEALGMALRILDVTPKALPLTVRATTIVKGKTINSEETITKEDIDGYYDCRVELNPEKDVQSDREVMLGRTLYKEGIIGWKKMLMDYKHETEDEAEDTMADAIAEQAVVQSPLLAQMRVEEAMEKIGATKYLEKIKAETAEQGKMNKELESNPPSSYRPSEVNNPTAVDTLRQALGETPMGVRAPATPPGRPAMKIGFNDKVLNRMVVLQGKISERISEKVKGDRPFAQKPMSDDEILWAIKNSSEQDRMTIANEYGVDALNKLLYKAVMIENRRK